MAQYICGRIKPARVTPQWSQDRSSTSIDKMGHSDDLVSGYIAQRPWGHAIENVALKKFDVLEMHTGGNSWVSVYYLNEQDSYDQPENICLAYDREGANVLPPRLVFKSTFRIEARTVRMAPIEKSETDPWKKGALWLGIIAAVIAIAYVISRYL